MSISIVSPKIGSTILCHVKGKPIRDMSNWMKMSVTKPVIWENPTDRSEKVDKDVWQGWSLNTEIMENISSALFTVDGKDSHLDWYDFTIPNSRFDIFIVKTSDISEWMKKCL